MDGHLGHLNPVVFEHEFGDSLGDPLNEEPPFILDSFGNVDGERPIVQGVGEVIGAAGVLETYDDCDIDNELLAVLGLLCEHAVVCKDPKSSYGDGVGHSFQPASVAEIMARARGPSGRPKISWITTDALMGSSSISL